MQPSCCSKVRVIMVMMMAMVMRRTVNLEGKRVLLYLMTCLSSLLIMYSRALPKMLTLVGREAEGSPTQPPRTNRKASQCAAWLPVSVGQRKRRSLVVSDSEPDLAATVGGRLPGLLNLTGAFSGAKPITKRTLPWHGLAVPSFYPNAVGPATAPSALGSCSSDGGPN